MDSPRRTEIQGLRALAVMLVIAMHAGVPGVSGGFVGVDVFFVVSGFVITSLLLRELAATGRVGVVTFYARRARRLLPAATLVLLATSWYAVHELSAVRSERVTQDALWAAVFLANVHFAAAGADYWAQGQATSPIQHYWSLAVEEQFYLFWPVAVAGIAWVTTGHRGRMLAGLALGILVASLTWSIVLTEGSPTSAYFSAVARAWELAVGALIALAAPRLARTPGPPWFRGALAGVGLALIGVAATTYGAGTAFPGWRAALPVVGTAALIVATLSNPAVGPARLLVLRPLPWVGDLSYSLYLWHWPVLVLGLSGFEGESASAARRVALVVLVLALSATTYYGVENPIRHSHGLLGGSRGLALWPVAVGSVVVGTLLISATSPGLADLRAAQALAFDEAQALAAQDAKPASPTPARRSRERVLPPSVTSRVHQAIDLAQAGAPIPFPLANQDLLAGDLGGVAPPCAADEGATSHDLCASPDGPAPVTLVVYGDSHAAMWLPSLRRLTEAGGFRVVPFVKYGCSPYDTPLGDPDGTECARYHTWALRQLVELGPDAVLLGSRTNDYLLDASAWRPGIEVLVRRLRDTTPELRLLADVSGLPFQPGDCLGDPDSTLLTCLAPVRAQVITGNRILETTAARLGLPYVDTASLVCGRAVCPTVVGDVMTYGDYDHISATWGRLIADEFGELVGLDELTSSRSTSLKGSGPAWR